MFKILISLRMCPKSAIPYLGMGKMKQKEGSLADQCVAKCIVFADYKQYETRFVAQYILQRNC